ncbi:hypothetical protein LVQ79_15355 [Buttiauxella sp. A2-C1_F]|uniref:hypothetical protein n=1 Tax=Buttiauxella sp. A2-C1_F TaxID=2904526 RepID=UPI001E330FA1|nr:hypothetical protein [Buttiauxella sp. A2-C1_F]
MSHINLITTCTNGKHGNGYNSLNLSEYSSGKTPSNVLIQSWCSATKEAISKSAFIHVQDLYKGGHWATAKSICNQYPVDLWVLSAGLGLLHCKDKVVPYQATFSTGYQESIPLFSNDFHGKSFHRTWWKEITERSVLKSEHPTSITGLMKEKPRDYFIICGSPDYINAIELDIINGLEYLSSPIKQVLIITSGKINIRLNEYLLKSDKKIADFLSCNMLMLNISLAQYFIKLFLLKQLSDLSILSVKLTEHFISLPEREVSKGIRRSPDDVSKYILNLLQQQPEISATKALRAFRDSGNSFEEKRFRTLFKTLSARNA